MRVHTSLLFYAILGLFVSWVVGWWWLCGTAGVVSSFTKKRSKFVAPSVVFGCRHDAPWNRADVDVDVRTYARRLVRTYVLASTASARRRPAAGAGPRPARPELALECTIKLPSASLPDLDLDSTGQHAAGTGAPRPAPATKSSCST